MCSLTNEEGSWQDCEGLTATEGEIVYFKDDPSLSKRSTYAEDATAFTSRTWTRTIGVDENIFAPGGDFGPNETNPYINLEEGSNIIQLTITDNMSRSASEDYTINGRPSLPEWKEIPPL